MSQGSLEKPEALEHLSLASYRSLVENQVTFRKGTASLYTAILEYTGEETNGYWFAKLECPPQRLSTFSALHGQNPTKSNGAVRVSGTIPRKDDSDFKSVQVLGIYSSNVRGVTEPTRQNCPVSFRGTYTS